MQEQTTLYQKQTKTAYYFIDIMKFIAAIMVIMIHTNPINAEPGTTLYTIEYTILRNAVPFFFICSSFFLFSKTPQYKDITRYVKRIFTLYLAWFLLMFPYTIILRVLHSDFSFEETLLRFYRSLIWTGSMQGAWFLFACIQSVILLYLFANVCKLKNWILLLIGLLFYLVGVCASSYWGIAQEIPFLKSITHFFFIVTSHPSFTFFSAFIFFVLGKIISEQRQNKHCLVILLCILCLIGILEFLELQTLYSLNVIRSNDNFFFTIPFAYILFQICLISKIKIKSQWCSYIRKSSIIYFLSQFPIITVCKILNIPNFTTFTITLICSSILSLLIIKYSNKYQFLKLLY